MKFAWAVFAGISLITAAFNAHYGAEVWGDKDEYDARREQFYSVSRWFLLIAAVCAIAMDASS